ncbi:MAG: DUF2269 family protein [Candidatus Limnocylindrales bacterium]
MELWQVFRLVHILSVVTALGANLTYAFWLRRAGRDSTHLVFVIESVRALDRRVANPAYIVAAIAGVGIVLSGPYGLGSPWIVTAIGLYVLIAALGITVYAPAIRTQLDLARRAPQSDAYVTAARRSQAIGLMVTGLVLLIVVLMVLKPALWAA